MHYCIPYQKSFTSRRISKNAKHYVPLYFHHEFAKSKSLQEIHKKHKPPCVINLIHGIPALGYFSSGSFMVFIEL